MITTFHLHKLFPIQFSWTDEDIYPDDENPGYSLNGEKDRNTKYPAEGSTVYIYNCFFHDIDNQAITYSSGGKMLVELSTFILCTSSSSGGCIYQKNGNFVMNKCCGVRCYSTNTSASGQFAYTTLSSGNKNNV